MVVNNPSESLITLTMPRSPASEAYRTLRTNLEFSSLDKPIKTMVVTSPGPEEGKSTIAANLAVVISQGGKKVALIDADMRKPRLHRILGLSNKLGLSAFFKRPARDLRSVVQEWEEEDLDVVTSGKIPPNPAELLGSKKMQSFLASFKHRFDYIIIDTPPVMPLTDACILGSIVDGALLIVQAGRTQRGMIRHAQSRLHQAGAKVLGYVMTNVEFHLPHYLYRYVQEYNTYSYKYDKVDERVN